MYYIGQRHIMRQLSHILPYLYDFLHNHPDEEQGMSILIRGPSGWGKTRLAYMICNYLSNNGKYGLYLGDKVNINTSMKVHFVDEIHLLENPEILYPLMDSRKYVFIFATNDVAVLREAFSNRCTEFIFDRYSNDELREICRTCVKTGLSDEFIDYIIESGAGNPRVIKDLISRLNIILIREPFFLKDKTLPQFKEIMKEIFGIKDGLNPLCIRYLEALSNLKGIASIQTLSSYLHVDQGTLKFEVEPVLLYKKLITISSKGRTLL